MEQSGKNEWVRNGMMNVLTDVHFWVPLVVLVGGLILLRLVH